MDVSVLEDRVRYLLNLRDVEKRYVGEKLWIELFAAHRTVADVTDVEIEEAVGGSDCVDVISAAGLVVGAEYMVEDANGCEEVIVLEILSGRRLRTVTPLTRAYAGGQLRRTTWQTLGIDGISAKAGISAVYWSKPLSLGEQTVSNYIHILRDNGPGVLTLHYRAASGSPSIWTPLSPNISEPSGTNDRYLRYTFPALTGDLLLKVVCSVAEVYVRHIVTHVPRQRTSGTWDSSGYKIADGRDISAIFARELNITGASTDSALLSDVGFELCDGVLDVTKIYSPATDARIGNRALTDEAELGTLIAITGKTITNWLQGIRNNLKWLFRQFSTADGHTHNGTDSKKISYNSLLDIPALPYATTAAPGVIRIATDPEAEAGAAQNICVTPAQLKRFGGGGGLIYSGLIRLAPNLSASHGRVYSAFAFSQTIQPPFMCIGHCGRNIGKVAYLTSLNDWDIFNHTLLDFTASLLTLDIDNEGGHSYGSTSLLMASSGSVITEPINRNIDTVGFNVKSTGGSAAGVLFSAGRHLAIAGVEPAAAY
jgi:hypothetical protein